MGNWTNKIKQLGSAREITRRAVALVHQDSNVPRGSITYLRTEKGVTYQINTATGIDFQNLLILAMSQSNKMDLVFVIKTWYKYKQLRKNNNKSVKK